MGLADSHMFAAPWLAGLTVGAYAGVMKREQRVEQHQVATLQDRAARQELSSYLGALREMGPGWEDTVAASFLAKMERRLDAIVEQRVQARLQSVRGRRGSTGRLVISLALAIPLSAIAAQFGIEGMAVVWVGILLLNLDSVLP